MHGISSEEKYNKKQISALISMIQVFSKFEKFTPDQALLKHFKI
jgi:hypothetical protein